MLRAPSNKGVNFQIFANMADTAIKPRLLAQIHLISDVHMCTAVSASKEKARAATR